MIANVINTIESNLLVCFPTETVYALACNALDIGSIEKMYQVKNRSQNKPFSISVSSIDSLIEILDLKEKYLGLIKYFSPGPITYVLPLKNNNMLPNEFFKGSVGVRIPGHPIALSILSKLKIPIVTTSMNISGEKSVYKSSDIPQSIRRNLSVVIEDDRLVSGIESTIVDLTGDKIKILRKGEVSVQVMCFQDAVERRNNEKSNWS